MRVNFTLASLSNSIRSLTTLVCVERYMSMFCVGVEVISRKLVREFRSVNGGNRSSTTHSLDTPIVKNVTIN
jgi:hypothetical protein